MPILHETMGMQVWTHLQIPSPQRATPSPTCNLSPIGLPLRPISPQSLSASITGLRIAVSSWLGRLLWLSISFIYVVACNVS